MLQGKAGRRCQDTKWVEEKKRGKFNAGFYIL